MLLQSSVQRSAEARATPDQVYALLADVARSVSHFPDLESIRPEGGTWVWRLHKIGAGPLSHQVHYACRYSFDPAARSVTWSPVPGVGNTQVHGRWIIEPSARGARFTLDTRFELELPFPRLMKSTIEELMQKENERILGRYLSNLVTTLEGGDGRAR
jgi:carbon monoxide dehydrogenase subunit G